MSWSPVVQGSERRRVWKDGRGDQDAGLGGVRGDQGKTRGLEAEAHAHLMSAFLPCSHGAGPAAGCSVSDSPQGRGRCPGTLLQPSFQLHHQQHLWGEGGVLGRGGGTLWLAACASSPERSWTFKGRRCH